MLKRHQTTKASDYWTERSPSFTEPGEGSERCRESVCEGGGAAVYLAGRTEGSLDIVAQEISKTKGSAKIARVDALDPKSVEDHLHAISVKAGKLDISFNLMATSVAIGIRLNDLSEERFGNAAFDRVRSNFITMTAAARMMEKRGSGVILGLTAPNARLPRPNMGGFAIGGAAIESLCRQLAFESAREEFESYVCGRVVPQTTRYCRGYFLTWPI